MTEATESRVEKVQKLLAKAERAGTPAEAEAFAAKAQELMTKWVIDDVMLRAHSPRDASQITKRTIQLRTTYWQADLQLLLQIADPNGVQVCYTPFRQGRWGKQMAEATLVGFATDVEAVEMLYTSLLIQLTRAQRNAVQPGWDDSSPHMFRRSFRFGFAVEVGRTLTARMEATVAESEAEYGGSLLPALVDKASQVTDAFADAFPDAQEKVQRVNVGPGATLGRESGRTADVGAGRVEAGVRGELS